MPHNDKLRAIIQTAKFASVAVDGVLISSIERGLVVYLGIFKDDTEETAIKMSQKIIKSKVFEDMEQKLNLSVEDINGEILLISNFTNTQRKAPNFSYGDISCCLIEII